MKKIAGFLILAGSLFLAEVPGPSLMALEAPETPPRSVDEATMMRAIAAANRALVEHNLLYRIASDIESRDIIRHQKMAVPKELFQAKDLCDRVIRDLTSMTTEDGRMNSWRDFLVEGLLKFSAMDDINIRCRTEAAQGIKSAACSGKEAAYGEARTAMEKMMKWEKKELIPSLQKEYKAYRDFFPETTLRRKEYEAVSRNDTYFGFTTVYDSDRKQLIVRHVDMDTDAEAQGIQTGDAVISINGMRDFQGKLDQLQRVDKIKPGEKVSLTLQRGQEEIIVAIKAKSQKKYNQEMTAKNAKTWKLLTEGKK